MSVGHVKSTPITNDLSVPVVANQAGKGAPGALVNVSASVALNLAAADDVGSTAQMVRVPTNAIVKSVDLVLLTGGSAGKYDLGVYYSNLPYSPSGASTTLVAATIDADFFAASLDCGGATSALLIRPGKSIGYDGVAAAIAVPAPPWTADDVNRPLWEAVGLSADPKGFFDLVLTTTEVAGTGGGLAMVSVNYVPGT
jgi:hypothetical protein